MNNAPHAQPVQWTKSSRSVSNGNCVETATIDGMLAVRDSKDPDGPILTFTYGAWRAFLADVREGSYDPPEVV
jgi:hypothetical protein